MTALHRIEPGIDARDPLRAKAPLGLVNVGSLCARVAWAIENSGLNASPGGLALTPLFQQPGILPAPSSPCHALVSPPPRCNGLESPSFPMPRPRPARRDADRGGCRGTSIEKEAREQARRLDSTLDLNWCRCIPLRLVSDAMLLLVSVHATRPATDVLRSHERRTKTIGGRPNSAMFPGSSTGSPCITTGEREAIFRMGFALRCFQRLSIAAWLPGAALSDNRCTRGRHSVFLSY